MAPSPISGASWRIPSRRWRSAPSCCRCLPSVLTRSAPGSLLEDYFGKLSLARKDFAGTNWWPRLLATKGRARIEEAALLFLRSGRPLPTEMAAYANLARLAEIEQIEREQNRIRAIEVWLLPPTPNHLDGPRAHCASSPGHSPGKTSRG